jgi:hypothetical protein
MKYIVRVQIDMVEGELRESDAYHVPPEALACDVAEFDKLTQAASFVDTIRRSGGIRQSAEAVVDRLHQARDACAAESQEELSEQEDQTRQRGIIEAVNEWADMAEISVLLLGTDSDRHIYADAILGTITTPRPAVLYSREKVIEAMVRESDGGTWQEMEEFYEYNTVRSLQYMSAEDNPPILVDEVVS